MKQTHSLRRYVNLIGSNKFFIAILIFMALQAIWIALSGRYPMAFDEDFHLGIIRLYAHHISPFWASQPKGANIFGAVSRDPSYLYQYLMSFPYRLISAITSNSVQIVLFLRAINVALFVSGLYLFRNLLVKTGAPKAAINLSLVIFTLLPVTPLLAAQINYDNLLLPVVAGSLIATLNFCDQLSKKKFNIKLLSLLLCLMLLGSIVKYAFLPIALVEFIYVLIKLKSSFGFKGRLLKGFNLGWKDLKLTHKLLLPIVVIISLGLFSQRYAVNIIKYHNPVPDCSKILSVRACSEYGPWIRDYNFKINKVDTEIGAEKNLVTFIADWFYGMWLRVFFAVDGPGTLYQSRGPLPIPSISAIVFGVAGLIAALIYLRVLIKRYSHLAFLLIASLFYMLTLWLDEFNSFNETGQPVAINGRYLLPALLPIILTFILATSLLLKDRLKLKVAVLVVSILCLAWGGGALTYILRSNDAWYWQTQPVYDLNHAVQHVIGPITPGDGNPALFLM